MTGTRAGARRALGPSTVLAGCAAVIVACILAAPAFAGTISITHVTELEDRFDQIVYADAATNPLNGNRRELDQVNWVTGDVSGPAQSVATISDDGQPILPDAGSSAVDVLSQCTLRLSSVSCRSSSQGLDVNVFLGGQADSATLQGGDHWYVDGGPGGDVLQGGPGDDGITGGPGNDRLLGRAGDDYVNDTNVDRPTSEADHIDPGAGRDHVYAAGNGDVVSARDGERDVIACFGSNAAVSADRGDTLLDCPNTANG